MSDHSRSSALPSTVARTRTDRLAFVVALVAALVVKAGWLPVVPW